MPVADYVSTRGDLLRSEQESFDASRAEATRKPLRRQRKPAAQTEGYKGQPDATKCGFLMPGGKGYCPCKPSSGCPVGRCGKGGHCGSDQCEPHGGTTPADEAGGEGGGK